MRLLFLTNIPTPYRSAFYDALAKEAAQSGDQLRVLYCATTEPGRHWPYEPEGMRHAHEVMPGWHFQLRKWYSHLNLTILARLQYLRPDIVAIAGAWNTPTMLLALAWCRLTGTPVYFWSEGHAAAVLNSGGGIAWARRRVYAAFTGFLVPNELSARWAASQARGPAIMVRLPNSIETTGFAQPAGMTKKEARSRLGLASSGTILIQVARVDAVKAPLELARTFLALPENYRRRARLVFIGTGSLHEQLGAIAKESDGSILVVGNVDAPRVREWLWAADCFVLNTKRDPNPLSPIEASAASLPILLSHLAGNVRELVGEGVTGWVIKDPDNPADELMRAIDCDEARRREMGEAARLRAKSFDVGQVAANLLRDLHALQSDA